MKKIVAVLLSLIMVCSLSVTAFAAEGDQSGSTTITVEVPDNTPSYTIHIPANTTIEYGNTEIQTIGQVFVTDVANVGNNSIFVQIDNTDLTDGNGHRIGMESYNKFSGDDIYESTIVSDSCVYSYLGQHYRTVDVGVKVASWADAVPGTNSATVTFSFYLSN